MLIPDCIHPEQTIYFNGAIVLQTLQREKSAEILDLYALARTEREMSLQIFMLCLDWLFLINAVSLTSHGRIDLCY